MQVNLLNELKTKLRITWKISYFTKRFTNPGKKISN